MTPHSRPAEAVAADLAALGIELEHGARRLAEYSYDASNYRVRPLGVVFPRDTDEVARLAGFCHTHGIALIARGGGTSMAGNAIGDGIVLDLSRHLHRVLDIDPDGGTAVAESGIVLTTLARAAQDATHGRLTFAPDPSSASRATLGGAIGNDACGNHSVRHGRTTDHIDELYLVTADGLQLTATRSGLHATRRGDDEAATRAGQLTQQLHRLTDRNLAGLRTGLETIPRQVSGYHLAKLLPENGFDVARALVGSEGTCAIVVAARVRLVPAATSPLLLCVGYRSVSEAARDITTVLPYEPSAVEGIDRRIVAAMAARRGRHTITALPGIDDPECTAWLFIDLDEHSAVTHAGPDQTDPDVEQTAERLLDELAVAGRMIGGFTVPDPAARTTLWRIREDGAGLSSRLADPGNDSAGAGYESWPGWEDAAVAPERLADYLDDFTELLERHRLTGVMYGHFGAGCMHVRITFDLRSAAGRAAMERFCTDAAHLVVAHGGSLSGEHGDGRARSALLPIMYSPAMLAAFAEFKRIWDPGGLLNPGSITDPAPITADLLPAEVPDRDWHTWFPLEPFAGTVQRCIGVGRCRTTSGAVMCPSYRATRDEKDSTRGRARVLQEMVRTAGTVDAGWRSAEAADALDLCLSCKACSVDCPTGVDMATYKSEFLHHHHAGRLRPLSHYSLGWMPAWLPFAGVAASIFNAALDGPLRAVAARAGGLDPRRSMPRFATTRQRRRHRRDAPGITAATDVIVLVDSFTQAFRPHLIGAATRVLGATGEAVGCTSDACCALTWISTGQLGKARKVLTRTAGALDDGTDRPIVVIEPSCAAALRKDLPELVGTGAARRVAARVHSFADQLPHLIADGWRPANLPEAVTLQTHCHEYAAFAPRTREVLADLGVEVRTADGCCGVAGNFGFERGHYEVSVAVAEQALAPALRAAPGHPVITDGFSCAMSVDHLTTVEPGIRSTGIHLAELLDPALPPHVTAKGRNP